MWSPAIEHVAQSLKPNREIRDTDLKMNTRSMLSEESKRIVLLCDHYNWRKHVPVTYEEPPTYLQIRCQLQTLLKMLPGEHFTPNLENE
jgi:hypothetical protein